MTILDICDQDWVTSNMRELWGTELWGTDKNKLPMFIDSCIEAGFANLAKACSELKNSEIVFANDDTYIAFDFNGNFNVVFNNEISWICVQGERFYVLSAGKWEKRDSLDFDLPSPIYKSVPFRELVQELYRTTETK